MSLRTAYRALRRGQRPARMGALRSFEPVCGEWGFGRGTPVDRWYIERFLAEHRADITGCVLEVKDSGYTDRFGADVEEAAVADIDPQNQDATHVADLGVPGSLPAERFDCFVLTQTLQYVFDLRAALANAHQALRSGGVLLVTVPVVSKISESPDDLWHLTAASTARLLEEAFGPGAFSVQARGNLLTQTAFLHGLAAEDLTEVELDHEDETFPLMICARAVRSP